ncbi:cobalamin biosynthesis protein CobW [Agaricicola taiwanensis]|uniref:Cobalamin biosynthesis protein CobW n=1 Tax=Agaricicola taiwanensis TaxID=591372 RepID=A0A8J2YCV8_9RHOB|nr:GTP-binding protein [Agaricicola taiwanensis]GGE31896.1 cobalamin biosynthesis protein CobW [Agaricicola taiwanensis]
MTPITLLTGFLGSGKTTLLSRLLKSNDFRDTAVIINEFGDVSLDHDLVDSADETIVTLSNGCLCCQVSSDLASTLSELNRRRSAGEITFKRVMIETSGLADPVPLLHALGTDHVIAMDFTLAGVVTVVDAVAGKMTLERYGEARRQVALADVLLMSKVDLEEARREETTEILATINPAATVADACHWDGSAASALIASGVKATMPRMFGRRHSQRFSTVTLLRERPLPALAVPLLLEGLAAHLGDRLLRLKGLIALEEIADRPMVVHAVQHMVHKPEWLDAWPSPDRRSRIVLIGHDILPDWPGLLLDAIEDEVRDAAAASIDRKAAYPKAG